MGKPTTDRASRYRRRDSAKARALDAVLACCTPDALGRLLYARYPYQPKPWPEIAMEQRAWFVHEACKMAGWLADEIMALAAVRPVPAPRPAEDRP